MISVAQHSSPRSGSARVTSPAGASVYYEVSGSGPALVLVHGSFSDHRSNWENVAPILAERFALHAVARRGRGETDASTGHSVTDEAQDVAAVIEGIGRTVFLLGHSYGAQVALAAAAMVPHLVDKLILYEPPWPETGSNARARLDELARAGDWDGFALTFFHDGLLVPSEELEEVRASQDWAAIIADAPATLHDMRAMTRYPFDPERFRDLELPVLLQIGSESPRHLFVTDALAATLPDVRIEELPGQAHEGMTTAPELYADSVTRFLLG